MLEYARQLQHTIARGAVRRAGERVQAQPSASGATTPAPPRRPAPSTTAARLARFHFLDRAGGSLPPPGRDGTMRQREPEGSRWNPKVPDETRRFPMKPEGSQWNPKVPNETRRFPMKPEGSRWNPKVPNETRGSPKNSSFLWLQNRRPWQCSLGGILPFKSLQHSWLSEVLT